MKAAWGIRAAPEIEELGLDLGEHGAFGYPEIALNGRLAIAEYRLHGRAVRT
ncbi:MAG TPA: hypothetical protein VHF67_13930 [Gaiellaceae bacterium]|nr:hypothetical protein [Gaiellaceae bacterium]